ncbi:NAD-dependent succinate-semialdehyde dehydrogenase [Kangiella geojedonensis]|uniref:Succinate-semialdehyde dehydrogenase n=1 Tax=Kangiella geojedonensis TaxID=914150 RepID=A0A0F6RC28_9GAMM|nr:NAD-dependent succinate-semialdehyde dehydrogenase [Kangiella geojedonensis]AKE52058.1 succinate-semialdehyde dehydrogenase [Kangiella geojedonensis]
MNKQLLKEQAYINGQWISADNTFEVDNPFDNGVIATVADCTAEHANQAIEAASKAFASWSRTTAKERSNLLLSWHSLIIDHADDLAEVLTIEQGKPLQEAKNEILYGASYIKWFAEEALRINGDLLPSPDGKKQIQIHKQPVGVVGIITPWNFPQAMIARKVAPAFAAGCTVVIKPASETPLSALAMAELAEQAGFPKGVINVVPSTASSDIGKALTSHPAVRKISFTGSTAVGKKLIAQSAENVQKVTMELGGNAPFIVFDDADLDEAVDGLMASKFRNSGQTCVCANRIFVHETLYDEFIKRLGNKVSDLKLGNGLTDGVQITPLINQKGIDKVFRLIKQATESGAEILAGGNISSEFKNIFEPTVLSKVDKDMEIACEEIFGPVVALIPFSDDNEVISAANNTSAGLASYAYTENRHRINRLVAELQYGMVGINTGMLSNEMAPFGGVKESGMGREGSKYGISDYLDIKYACIN